MLLHRATKITELPALSRDFLHNSCLLMDNVFASLWQQIGMKMPAVSSHFDHPSGRHRRGIEVSFKAAKQPQCGFYRLESFNRYPVFANKCKAPPVSPKCDRSRAATARTLARELKL